MAESLAEFFLTNFRAHARERAYGQHRGYRMEWFAYGQLLDMALQFSRELGERGIGKGERVMLWGENSAQWVGAFFGCTLRGVVVVPMDDAASADFAARVSGQVEAGLWVCSRKHAVEASGVPCIVLDDLTPGAGGTLRLRSGQAREGPSPTRAVSWGHLFWGHLLRSSAVGSDAASLAVPNELEKRSSGLAVCRTG